MSEKTVTRHSEIVIPCDNVPLAGTLTTPGEVKATVVFVHGSGSGRFSPRNQYVADVLRPAGFATMLLDLLSPEEKAIDQYTRHLRFDIHLLTRRVTAALDWLAGDAEFHECPVGMLGASTGAAAALAAAAERPQIVRAVVSRGGRPDLAGDTLPRVNAPTLFIVGGFDTQVLELNRRAAKLMKVENRLDVIPGAAHLFEEPGTLEEAANRARDWFCHHLLD